MGRPDITTEVVQFRRDAFLDVLDNVWKGKNLS